MEKMVAAYESGACVFIYDNFRVPHGIKHQRMDYLTVTDNGTTATLIPLPKEATALLNDPSKFAEHRKSIKERYMTGTMRFLEPQDFHQPEVDAHINECLECNILTALFRIPEIAQLRLEVQNDPLLQPPPPVDSLPAGKEHISKQFMFGTMDHDESTLTGGARVQGDMLGQLKQTSLEKRKKLGTSRMQCIVGDNLTDVRGLSLQQLKQAGLNSFDRHDWIIWAPGWFHLLMNFGRAIYFEHYGTSTGLLLARDVATLGWSGLTQPTRNKGPDFHTLDEALHIILQARYQGLWLWATGTSSTLELVDWVKNATAEQLKATTHRIWIERASQRALATLASQKTQMVETIGHRKKTTNHNEDQVLEASIRLQHDLMLFEECRRAMRNGDVGQMDHLLPRLLMCFAGSKRWNYVREILNILQWEWNEAPKDIAEAVRRYAWLVNFNGERDGFYAHDLHQELNNLIIRLNGPSPQSSTWKRYREISPAMPTLSEIVDQYDRHWSSFYASHQHYVRDADRDIAELVGKHQAAKIFTFDGARTTSTGNITRNILDEGQQFIMSSKYLGEYARDRQTQYGPTNTLELYEADGVTISDAINKLRNAYNPETDCGNTPDDPIMEYQPPAEGVDETHVTPRLSSDIIDNSPDDPHAPVEGKYIQSTEQKKKMGTIKVY
ncbi:hypothetical protein FRC11_012135 [Ceratobasidium sp. 423]|nr:hypothetical protein FRC11_012135 [Ceratobasidium sp. 423]